MISPGDIRRYRSAKGAGVSLRVISHVSTYKTRSLTFIFLRLLLLVILCSHTPSMFAPSYPHSQTQHFQRTHTSQTTSKKNINKENANVFPTKTPSRAGPSKLVPATSVRFGLGEKTVERNRDALGAGKGKGADDADIGQFRHFSSLKSLKVVPSGKLTDVCVSHDRAQTAVPIYHRTQSLQHSDSTVQIPLLPPYNSRSTTQSTQNPAAFTPSARVQLEEQSSYSRSASSCPTPSHSASVGFSNTPAIEAISHPATPIRQRREFRDTTP